MVVQEKLIVYLHAEDPSQPQWATQSSAHHGDIDQLTYAAKERDVIVVVPATDMVLVSIQMPKMSRSRMLQALPFALEEQLVADVETLHFAAGELDSDGRLPVAVVAKEKMTQWLSLLNSWDIKPGMIISSVFTMPGDANDWQVLVTDTIAVRYGAYQGFGCDKENLADFLRVLLDTSPALPHAIKIKNYTQQEISSNLKLVVAIDETRMEANQFVADIAKSGIHAPVINLLQGQYTSKKARLPQWQLGWKVAAMLGIAFIAALFIKPLVSVMLLGQHLHGLNQDIASIYKRHFPNSSSIVAPKQRMQEKWQQLAAATGENQALLQLGILGQAMAQAQSIKIKRFDYQAGDTTIELSAGSSDDFSAFTDYLTAQGLKVKQQNANLIEGRISATIQITAS